MDLCKRILQDCYYFLYFTCDKKVFIYLKTGDKKQNLLYIWRARWKLSQLRNLLKLKILMIH